LSAPLLGLRPAKSVQQRTWERSRFAMLKAVGYD
jgi:hypothetical protein